MPHHTIKSYHQWASDATSKIYGMKGRDLRKLAHDLGMTRAQQYLLGDLPRTQQRAILTEKVLERLLQRVEIKVDNVNRFSAICRRQLGWHLGHDEAAAVLRRLHANVRPAVQVFGEALSMVPSHHEADGHKSIQERLALWMARLLGRPLTALPIQHQHLSTMSLEACANLLCEHVEKMCHHCPTPSTYPLCRRAELLQLMAHLRDALSRQKRLAQVAALDRHMNLLRTHWGTWAHRCLSGTGLYPSST